ncbi:MAG: sigma 54-interacting transcriptional regulator [Gemmatimonadaceae bacterium]
MSQVDACRMLIGDSIPMRQLRAVIARVAASALPVLIEGETGAGKELVARALHQASGRGGALVSFNVCAIADTMFEDALFGHVRGAYTGAVQSAPGYLAEANGGTLFLDEISGLPSGSQAKLLRAIETKEFRPVGANADRRSDFRVVAASNESLASLVEAGRFRRDLSHRLGGIRLAVPALRERAEDIPALVHRFSAQCTVLGTEPVTFSESALRRLQAYNWPGNVRELRYVVEAASTLAIRPMLGAEDVTPFLVAATGAPERRAAYHDQQLLTHLEQSAWDINEAARRLGVHRATVYRRLKRLQVETRSLSEGLVATRDVNVVAS